MQLIWFNSHANAVADVINRSASQRRKVTNTKLHNSVKWRSACHNLWWFGFKLYKLLLQRRIILLTLHATASWRLKGEMVKYVSACYLQYTISGVSGVHAADNSELIRQTSHYVHNSNSCRRSLNWYTFILYAYILLRPLTATKCCRNVCIYGLDVTSVHLLCRL